MKLKTSAKAHLVTPIEALDNLGNWIPWTNGRFSTVDRFLSNFHRPLQRRMLFSDPDVPLPDSWVVRNAVTGEVYLLGQSRYDTDEDQAYTRLTVAHYASSDAADEITIHRKVVDTNRPPTTIGELVDTVVGTVYGTFEHKQTSEQYNADDYFLTKYVVFMPHGTDVEMGDVLTDHNGTQYTVESTYNDSDFKSMTVERKPDQRVTGTYLQPNASYNYDVTTGVVTKSYDQYLFTCELDSYKADKGLSGNTYDVEVFVKTPSLPVEIKVGFKIMVGGVYYMVQRIERNFEADYQIRLLCTESSS
ncbi:hypothetical protein RBG11_004264 [Vibrio parahaemolyticus]|nr:hypothetical protein [Vibrio parahaemolyticus]